MRAKTNISRLHLDNRTPLSSVIVFCFALESARMARKESFRVISTARLRTLPPVHLPPINVVVCNDPNKEILS